VFDELLGSESFKATSRGSGTLVLDHGYWYIHQYHLTFPIPNPLAKGMCISIAKYEETEKEGTPVSRADAAAAELLAELDLEDASKPPNKSTKSKKKGHK
jgi:hypothetical protein